MGYAVVHLEKAKGSDSGMSAHIERTIAPKNADVERTHLNREMVEFPEGVENRTQAIQHRLANVGLTRKIGKNQVQAIRIMLTGTHEDMVKIESDGHLDDWTNDNLDWLRHTYGADNLVSAVLHLDEKTPHIHATVVPIVTTERQRRKREEAVKKKYKTKSTTTPRLCADEVMSRVKLKEYQNSYAESMASYGLHRGIEGSDAKHISTSKYYRELMEQTENIQQEMSSLLEFKELEQAELVKIQSEKSREQFKNSAADVGTKVMDGVSSILGTSKMKRIEKESQMLKVNIETLKLNHSHEINDVKAERESFKQDLQNRYSELKIDFESRELVLRKEITSLKSTITKVLELIPEILSHLRFTELCKAIGFPIEIIRQLINGEEVSFSGNLFSKAHNKRFNTENSVVKRHQPDETQDATLLIDNKHHTDWFREQHRKQPQQKRGRGI